MTPTLRRIVRWSFQIYSVSIYTYITLFACTHLTDRQQNNQNIHNYIRNGIAHMHLSRGQTVFILRLAASPVGSKVGAAEEEQQEEEANRPGCYRNDHKHGNPAEFADDIFGEDAAVEEEEAQFYAAEGRDLEEFGGPAGL
jgi:hypothetical protein